jgi:hypothetical protein
LPRSFSLSGGDFGLATQVGREELLQVSRCLSLSDRFRVMQAVSKGRAVRDVRLAHAAVLRARYVRGFSERVSQGRMRWWRAVGAAGAAIAVAGNIFLLVSHEESRPFRWFNLATQAYVLRFFLYLPRMHRRAIARANDAERLNEELVATASSGRSPAGREPQ